MASAPRWITVSAASALGLGIIATSAVGVANAMPLVDSTTTASVPPISTVPDDQVGDVKGWFGPGDATLPVPSPTASAPNPVASSSAPPPAVQPAPVQPAPVQPAPPPQPVSVDSISPVSPVSPASVDSVD